LLPGRRTQLLGRGRRVLQRDGGQSDETVGALRDELGDVAVGGCDDVGGQGWLGPVWYSVGTVLTAWTSTPLSSICASRVARSSSSGR